MIDYPFLRGYLDKEADRLQSIEAGLNTHIANYKARIDKLKSVTDEISKDWQYGRQIQNLEDKILEANIKLSAVQPKRKKLLDIRDQIDLII